jgi:hypothetical protein
MVVEPVERRFDLVDPARRDRSVRRERERTRPNAASGAGACSEIRNL